MPKNVVVIGMPRSGTSLTASIFANAGYFAAEDNVQLRDGDRDNPGGYFEASSLIDANADILNAAGFPFHNTWLFDKIDTSQIQAIGELEHSDPHRALLQKFESNAPWIWKDPRLCYTLSYWWPLFDADTTEIVVARRRPEQIWNSFLRLGWRDDTDGAREDVYERIEEHIQTALATIRSNKIPHIEIHYDEYAGDPAAVAKKINEVIGTKLTATDLGYNKRYNHSSLYGKFEEIMRAAAGLMPASVKTFLRSVLKKGR